MSRQLSAVSFQLTSFRNSLFVLAEVKPAPESVYPASTGRAGLQVSSITTSFTPRYQEILYTFPVAPNAPRPWSVGRRGQTPAAKNCSSTPVPVVAPAPTVPPPWPALGSNPAPARQVQLALAP